MKKGVWNQVGFDESNNGFEPHRPQLPAIYVSTFSNLKYHTKFNRILLPKYRKNHRSLPERLNKADYNFLLLTKTEYELIPSNKLIGIILTSLLFDEKITPPLKIYVDGSWGYKTKDFTKTILSETKNIPKDLIYFSCGKDWDRRYPLVNIADETAHWLTKKSLRNLRKSKKRKDLLIKELRDYILNFI